MVNFSMTRAEYWHNTTPLQAEALVKAFRVKRYIDDLQVAQLHLTYLNSHIPSNKPKAKLSDIIGPSPIKVQTKKADPATILKAFQRLFPVNKRKTRREILKEKRAQKNGGS